MSRTAHPSAAVLARYVSGSLRPAFAVVAAAHIERCAECRDGVRVLEAECGDLVSELPPSEMGDQALARVMAGIEHPFQPAALETRPAIERIPLGPPQRLVAGVQIRRARLAGSADLLYLLHAPAGVQTILHGHDGAEFTTVIKGSFDDGEQVFRQGDFVEAGEGVDHSLSATLDGECICLIASERPMRVRTLTGLLVQWLARV